MKRDRQLLSVASILLVFITGSANAALLEGTDPRFGPNSLTIDTRTQLAWLDLTDTLGLSYQQVLAETAPGMPFSGYRFATLQEVTNLFYSAGITLGYYPLTSPAIQSFISLVGQTQTIEGYPALFGLTGTPRVNQGSLYLRAAIYASGINGSLFYLAENDFSIDQNLSFPDMGSWLVTTVPEPTSLTIGLLGLCGLSILRSRRGDPATTA